MRRLQILLALALMTAGQHAEAQTWPTVTTEAKAGTRWWWPGCAVDEQNLAWSLQSFAQKGIGTVEITPIYGVQGNEAHDISFLSPRWMQVLRFTEAEGKRVGIDVDMNTGTGWPFGGPTVPLEEAACKAVFADTVMHGRKIVWHVPLAEKERPYAKLLRVMASANGRVFDVTDRCHDGLLEWKAPRKAAWRLSALFQSRTRQRVKRAAPGGEGWVIDHFDRLAVQHYLERFDSAFAASGTAYPKTFFNDSYEVYGADWTPSLLDEFLKRRGYRLEDSLAQLIDRSPQVLSDYRETLSELLLENFTRQWTQWAHRHGALTRNQAHGSPANLIDVYAEVDIPEIEGFGLSDFGIRGLRTDSGFTRANFCDVSMLKYASSAAHITGKPLVSSETFTWLTEHFRTSLSQMKPDLDLMFACGVNHVFFHGSCYSPKDEAWPGWRFYASIDMTPNNTIWRDADALLQYIARCQSVLQSGTPDNDFLVYLPVRDMWLKNTKDNKMLMMFDIHSMDEKAPDFIRCINEIDAQGYDCDYISDRYLLSTTFADGMLQTQGGARYKALIVPHRNNRMPDNVRRHLEQLRQQGARIIVGTDARELSRAASPEALRQKGLRAMRRRSREGYTYFVANLTPRDVCAWVPLSTSFRDAAIFNAMNGDIRKARTRGDSVQIALRSGESLILQTYHRTLSGLPLMPEPATAAKEKVIDTPWRLSFVESVPAVGATFTLDCPAPWETLTDSTAILMGTGVYETTFALTAAEASEPWQIDLGDVRESARVYLNGRYLGCAWAVPFVLNCGTALRKGANTLRIEVTNLPANHIAWMDRAGIGWRKMKEINVVDIHYKKTRYDNWAPMPSGLVSPVRLVSR